MRCMPEVHAHEVHAHEVYARDMHAHEVHACEMICFGAAPPPEISLVLAYKGCGRYGSAALPASAGEVSIALFSGKDRY